MKNFVTIVILFCFFYSNYSKSQAIIEKIEYPLRFVENSFTPADSSIDSTITEIMETYHLPGLTACIVNDGELTWKHAFGFANFEQNQVAKDSTLFLLASVSKTVVAVAAMQLWEQGMLELNDPINDYLPFPIRNPNFPDDTITIKMLLTHTSSLKDNWGVLDPLVVQGDSPIPLGDFLYEYFTPGGTYYNQYSNFYTVHPGAEYKYSNVAVCVAAYIVEVISGMSFDQYCNSMIFQPLNMMETSWFISDMDTNHVAMPYRWNGIQFIPYGHYGCPDYPDGQLRSSTIELSRFMSAVMQMGELNGNRILDSTTVAFMLSPQIANIDSTVGIIWGRFFWEGREFWGHAGAYKGCTTLLLFCPSSNWGAIILTNGEDPSNAAIIDICISLWNFDHQPKVFIISPNGGEVWATNDTVNITWTSEIINYVKIELSINNGISWTSVVDSVPSSGIYSWIVDTTIAPSTECLMKITDISDSAVYDESDSVFKIENPISFFEASNNIPIKYQLKQNYPNPFNPFTLIKYSIPKNGMVTLKVYDILGKDVMTLVNENQKSGDYSIKVNASNLSTGVYLYRLESGKYSASKKMILLK